jgi:3-deoxy-D-manno-octulosonic-acid transferase
MRKAFAVKSLITVHTEPRLPLTLLQIPLALVNASVSPRSASRWASPLLRSTAAALLRSFVAVSPQVRALRWESPGVGRGRSAFPVCVAARGC